MLIVYIICGIVIVLAILIFVREIRKMIKGKCCDNCKHCKMQGKCDVAKKDEKDDC